VSQPSRHVLKRAIPGDVVETAAVLDREAGDPHLVGGAVRDLILGLEPSDYDIATRLRPHEVMALFEGLGWRVVPKGVEYGVVSVIHPETRREIEIATFRKEWYGEPGNRRNVAIVYSDRIEDDLARRDFTINAMAVSMSRGRFGELVDPFGGMEDLRRGIIRFVGRPEERIREDPLRSLRAVRFAAKLGYEIDTSSMEAIRRLGKWILNVSRERWGEEIRKASGAPRFARFIRLMVDTSLHKFILPELDDLMETYHGVGYHHRGESVYEHTLEALSRADAVYEWGLVRGEDAVVLRLAVLFHDFGKPDTWSQTCTASLCRVQFIGHERVSAEKAQEVIVNRWRLPWSIARRVSAIIRAHHAPLQMPSERLAEALTARYGDIAYLLALHAYADTGEKHYLTVADEVKRLQSRPKPLLNGRDVMGIYGLKPGPWVGAAKQILYMVQLATGAASKETVVARACDLGILCPARDTTVKRLLLASPDEAVAEAARILAWEESRLGRRAHGRIDWRSSEY